MPTKKKIILTDENRCSWCLGKELYTEYHDTEWGVPEYDDRALWEKLILDGAQAGLSWWTILSKRENYRKAFDQFNPEKVARYTEKKRAKLMLDAGIVRNKLKINAAIVNAQLYLDIMDKGSFKDYLWDYVDGEPIINNWKTMADVPANTPLSDTISKRMKKDGFKFVGTTIVYAFMQAVGMVNDHVITCPRHQELS